MGSIYDNTKYLYAEQLKGKRVTMTIKQVVGGVEFVNPAGKQKGFDIHFEETPKILGVAGTTVRRQIFAATQEDDFDKLVGKKITVYPVKSARSATGQAIRVAVPEQMA